MLLSIDYIVHNVFWPSERTRLSLRVSFEGISMFVFSLSGTQPLTFLDPHPWPLVYCKYCKIHFDIIDMFWYVSHNQWVQLKISYKESVSVFCILKRCFCCKKKKKKKGMADWWSPLLSAIGLCIYFFKHKKMACFCSREYCDFWTEQKVNCESIWMWKNIIREINHQMC